MKTKRIKRRVIAKLSNRYFKDYRKLHSKFNYSLSIWNLWSKVAEQNSIRCCRVFEANVLYMQHIETRREKRNENKLSRRNKRNVSLSLSQKR